MRPVNIEFLLDGYNPGKNPSRDTFYSAFQYSSRGSQSYYRTVHFGRENLWASIGNASFNWCRYLPSKDGDGWKLTPRGELATCGHVPLIAHGFGNRMTQGILEIYPREHNRLEVGNCRITVDGWGHLGQDRAWSPQIGRVVLPFLNDRRSGSISGTMIVGGERLDNARVSFFQTGDVTARSSAGYPIRSFCVVNTSPNGTFETPPLFRGSYQIFLRGHSGPIFGVSCSKWQTPWVDPLG